MMIITIVIISIITVHDGLTSCWGPQVGDRVVFPGHEGEPLTPAQVRNGG
jgi:hypothetical protein